MDENKKHFQIPAAIPIVILWTLPLNAILFSGMGRSLCHSDGCQSTPYQLEGVGVESKRRGLATIGGNLVASGHEYWVKSTRSVKADAEERKEAGLGVAFHNHPVYKGKKSSGLRN